MGLTAEERKTYDSISIDDASSSSDEDSKSTVYSFNTEDTLHMPLSEDKYEKTDNAGEENLSNKEMSKEENVQEGRSCSLQQRKVENNKDNETNEKLDEYQRTIETLKYQNALNLSRLEEHVTKEEEWMRKKKEYGDIENAVAAHKQENEELREELKLKKKFAFSV